MIINEQTLMQERDRRIVILNDIMEKKGLDGVLMTSCAMPTFQLCLKYFTNYFLSSRRAFVTCKKGEMPYLILPTPGQQYHAQNQSWLPEDHILSGVDMMPLIKNCLSGCKTVGWYWPDEIPSGVYKSLMTFGFEFIDFSQDLTLARANKSEYEIQLTKDASKLAADSFAHILKLMKPGETTEAELIGAAEGYLRAHGMQDSLLLTRSSKPHSFITRAQNKPIQKNGLFVYSAEVAGKGGYWTQMVRPVFFSRDAQPEAQEILKVGHIAEAEGIKYLKPGYRICDVGEAIESKVREYGFKTGVWSGHGMGPDLGDAVDIGSSVKMEIVPNMIITLHPSIVSDTDGLLYGNTFLTTEDQPINLTDYYNDSPFLEDLLQEL